MPEAARTDSRHEEPEVREPEALAGIMGKPLGSRLWTYTKLSGPGWLQSAITLGGGSLASSLYLGVLGGFALLWLQPVAMILGVIMLSAIGYVALSTGERPFHAVNEHVNPVLGWGWAIATAMANIVWCLPQFSLGVAAVRENLFSRTLGDAAMGTPDGIFWSKALVAGLILAAAVVIIWFYDTGARGIRIFETLLKVMVGVIILCFFGVIVKMSIKGALNWGGVLGGFVPDFRLLSQPASTFDKFLADTREFADYWRTLIVSNQRDVMISAAATAVGINMTFLLPYSMLAKGWRRNARGLAIFDLSTGLFIPFILATSCIVITSASRFHASYDPGLLGEPNARGRVEPAAPNLLGPFNRLLDGRVAAQMGKEKFAALPDEQKGQQRAALPRPDKVMAGMLVKRDAFNLAESLRPLTGGVFSHYVFGIGVIGMALSSIIILMLISGFVVCEMLGLPARGNAHRLACMLPVVGVLGPFIWGSQQAQFWLAVPTSLFGMVLAPIAYWTFFFLMNSRSLLGDSLPRGGRRVAWNVLMLVAAGAATFGSVWVLWSNFAWKGVGILFAFLALALIVHFIRKTSARAA